MPCHVGPLGKHYVMVRRQRRKRGKPEPGPELEFPQEG